MKILSRTTRKINGKWHARVRYEDDNGKKGELLRRAEGKWDAENLKAKLVTELLEKGPTQLIALGGHFKSGHVGSPENRP